MSCEDEFNKKTKSNLEVEEEEVQLEKNNIDEVDNKGWEYIVYSKKEDGKTHTEEEMNEEIQKKKFYFMSSNKYEEFYLKPKDNGGKDQLLLWCDFPELEGINTFQQLILEEKYIPLIRKMYPFLLRPSKEVKEKKEWITEQEKINKNKQNKQNKR